MTTQETTASPTPVAATHGPRFSGDWIAWRARVDEKLEHMSTKADLERLKVWMILTSLSVGALVVAAVKVIP